MNTTNDKNLTIEKLINQAESLWRAIRATSSFAEKENLRRQYRQIVGLYQRQKLLASG